jgi:hypothetical protein
MIYGTCNEMRSMEVYVKQSGKTSKQPTSLHDEVLSIMQSSEAVAAAIAASASGLPALEGVLDILKAHLGKRFTPDNDLPSTAGATLATVMIGLGYHNTGRGKLPKNPAIKTGAIWSLKQHPT